MGDLGVELLLLSKLKLSLSSSESVCVGDGGTTIQRVVTLTLPLARFFTSHKSVSFFFIVETLSTVATVGRNESLDLLDCILIDFLQRFSRKVSLVSNKIPRGVVCSTKLRALTMKKCWKLDRMPPPGPSPSSIFDICNWSSEELSMTQIFCYDLKSFPWIIFQLKTRCFTFTNTKIFHNFVHSESEFWLKELECGQKAHSVSESRIFE